MNCPAHHIAHVIHEWRSYRGLKISVAARELGVSTATWGHWEEGRRTPTVSNLQLLSIYTKIPVQHFLCPHHKQCPFARPQ
jgi:DNA-binding transcriptional regulator YiaG